MDGRGIDSIRDPQFPAFVVDWHMRIRFQSVDEE
jgi:hypothetical protein